MHVPYKEIHVVLVFASCLRSVWHATWIVGLLAVLLAIHQLSQATLGESSPQKVSELKIEKPRIGHT